MQASEREQCRTSDLHNKLGPIIWSSGHVLDLPQGQHSVDNSPEHHMLAIKKIAFSGRDKKLDVLQKLGSTNIIEHSLGIH